MNAFPRIPMRRVAALAILGTAALAGCTSTQHAVSAQTSASAPTGSTSATSSPPVSPPADATSGSSASVPPASGSATPQPTAPTPPAIPLPTTSSGTCLSGTFAVVNPGTDNPVHSACLHLGTAVSIELLALRGVTWSAPTDSDPSVATVTDQVTQVGTRHDRVTLLHPGTVTFTSVSSFGPDPSGPASRSWSLTLTIVP